MDQLQPPDSGINFRRFACGTGNPGKIARGGASWMFSGFFWRWGGAQSFWKLKVELSCVILMGVVANLEGGGAQENKQQASTSKHK